VTTRGERAARSAALAALAAFCLASSTCSLAPASRDTNDLTQTPDLDESAAAPRYAWRLPRGFPEPPVPASNPMSEAKVELGRHLFYDPRLSGPGSIACATCHRQELAFTDGRARARGALGDLHPRSAMSLVNAAYSLRLGWADPELRELEQQVRVPLFNEAPVEMGVTGRESEVLTRLAASEPYPALFRDAFPGEADPITLDNVTRSLASFERTLISGSSAYDRLLFRDESRALSPSARRGMELFFSDSLGCSGCHVGLNFSAPSTRAGAKPPEPAYHNTGLYDLGEGRYPAPNEGLLRATGRPQDMGRFRAPTLRNIAVTAPYMHDGSLASLEAVIDHYAAGGRAAGNPYKNERLRGFSIDAQGKADLVVFLQSLTDETFLRDPRFASPFGSAKKSAAHD